jgi:hypothetical protein
MKQLSTVEIHLLHESAIGPVSYLADGPKDKRTHAKGVTVQSETYTAMMKYGWVPEVI